MGESLAVLGKVAAYRPRVLPLNVSYLVISFAKTWVRSKRRDNMSTLLTLSAS